MKIGNTVLLVAVAALIDVVLALTVIYVVVRLVKHVWLL